MKKSIAILSTFFLFFSCGSGEDYYSYLSDPETATETAKMKFVVSADQSVFDYTVQAKEMVIDWGDGSDFSEYIFFDNINQSDSIKTLSRTYSSQGTYDITVKAMQLRGLLLSRTGDNYLNEISLTGCRHLRKLYCDNQRIQEIDISECPELRVLSCGYPEGELSLTGVSTPKKLGELYINGPLESVNLELADSDSLRIIQLIKTNLPDIQLSGLGELEAIQINSCSDLANIYIGGNWLLSDIVLTDNTSLDAGALNDLFEDLPSVDNDNRYITLSGNKGDDTCNRNIAVSKGWSFR